MHVFCIYICSRFKVNSKHYAVALLCNNCHANIKHIERERERAPSAVGGRYSNVSVIDGAADE